MNVLSPTERAAQRSQAGSVATASCRLPTAHCLLSTAHSRSSRHLTSQGPDEPERSDPRATFSSPTIFRPDRYSTGSVPLSNQAVLDDFTDRWNRGEISGSEAYLELLGPVAPRLAVEVIYREYCLAERDGRRPDDAEFLARFPRYREALEPLLTVHRQCTLSEARGWIEPDQEEVALPETGDEIGPYILRRELGRGAFARVFLAEQADLEYRQVVVKISTRRTREPWLLARARHANIVEILSHAEVDDGAFQLICMPFLGGATFSTVLEHRRKVHRPRGARGGLLHDLDAVAAPEFKGVNPSRPARELLARLTDHQAMAWITARLAEALHHAFERKVAHGDVKPSNIILTADGIPMLLDFNLAQDWSPADSDRPLADRGGTLAYMAPERLRALAATASAFQTLRSTDLNTPSAAPPVDPHRADLYSLGKVLLEALTGATARETETNDRPGWGPGELAETYAAEGERGAEAVIENALKVAAQPIPRALQVILARCLAARPEDRYRHGQELAEDLDRWRTDRPLAYATEPFWAQTVPRRLRARKATLLASALIIAVSAATGFFLVHQSHLTLQNLGLRKIARYLDDIESHAFQFQRPASTRLQDLNAPELVEAATHALKDYDVLEGRDWRNGEAVRYLPPRERADLELWLMEQVFRYCLALCDRSFAAADWQRALQTLENQDTTPALRAFDLLRQRLIRKLARNNKAAAAGSRTEFIPFYPTAGRAGPPNTTAGRDQAPAASPRCHRTAWLDEYLLGVAAELIDDPATPPSDETGRARLALEHFQRLLAEKPDSFWGHYRSAVACFQLRIWPAAAGHLDHCLKLRPRNAALRGQYASCLWELGLLDDALQECNRAIDLAPGEAEFYQSRVFVRLMQDQTDGLEADLQRYELLRRSLGRSFFRTPPVPRLAEARPATVPSSHQILDLESTPAFQPDPDDPRAIPEEADPDELDARALVVATIYKTAVSALQDEQAESGMALPAPAEEETSPAAIVAIAAAELDKILALNPRHLGARKTRMLQLLKENRIKEATSDLEVVLNHPDLVHSLRERPEEFEFYRLAARAFAQHGLDAEALHIANLMLSLSKRLDLQQGRCCYSMATILAMSSQEHPRRAELAAVYLRKAFRANPRFRNWYRVDPAFDRLRLARGERLRSPVAR
ncbi:MAG: protein kinase domain-containing protein [Isosphaeraceae bacterium]